jgi:DtxR family transcriptional regulator, Mn-dependent transcriptional regulator
MVFLIEEKSMTRISVRDLSESLQDYLEAILSIQEKYQVARVKDIAEKLNILRGSVTGGLKSLAEKGLINYEPYSFITLTEQGKTIAMEITRRHRVIRDFLQCILLMEPEAADQNACRMEHSMDREAVDRLVAFIEYIYKCPRTGAGWIDGFVRYFEGKPGNKVNCRTCLRQCVQKYEKEQGCDG